MWDKPNKSNEPILIAIQEKLCDLGEMTSCDSSSVLITVVEIIFSGSLTYFVDNDIGLSSFLPCGIVFLGIIAVCKLLGLIIKGIKTIFTDRKKSLVGIFQLERFFYKKVLNDIITGISLEKKSCELQAEIKTSSSPTQDENLSFIYLVESVFYFHEALRSIADKNLFEVSNRRRKTYTYFLKEINPTMICDIFLACEETLLRIVEAVEKIEDGNANRSETNEGNVKTVHSAKKAYNLFVMYRREIHKQLGWSPVETLDLEIS